MFETQTAQTRVDELNWCRDGLVNPVNLREHQRGLAGFEPEAFVVQYRGLIGIGQKVFLAGDQFVGLTTKLYLNPGGRVSHLAIRTARLFGRHKMVPIASVMDVTSTRVLLSINRDQFMELPEFKADSTIAEEMDRALWKDVVLRDTDYHEIDIMVRDGIIFLNGHVITSMNQWRAEDVAKNIPGILGVKSYLIPDDKLTLEVAGVLGQIEQREGCKFFTKVENGLAVLMGEVSSISIRDQAEQCVAEIPWVRGVINEICVTGIVLETEDQRFLQPLVGETLLFKDALSVTVRRVVINPHNRRVVAVVVSGRFPDPQRQESNSDYLWSNKSELMVVLPVRIILNLTRSGGSIRINSDETTEYKDYDPSRYISPGKDWLPPYPYCTTEVLFLTD